MQLSLLPGELSILLGLLELVFGMWNVEPFALTNYTQIQSVQWKLLSLQADQVL